MSKAKPDKNESRRQMGLLLDELKLTLAAEQQALTGRDADALEAAAARKLSLVTALEEATGNYCRAGGKLEQDELRELRRQAQACARANRANGGAIELNRNLVGRLLDTLRGAPRGPATYNANGRLQRGGAGRPVGHA